MKRLMVIVTVGLLSIFVVACGMSEESTGQGSGSNSNTNNEAGKEGKKTMEYQDFLYELEAEVSGNTITVKMELINKSKNPHEVAFSSGQEFDLYLKDENGDVLYNYADGKMFTQAIQMKQLSPDESLLLQDTWESEKISSLSKVRVEASLLIYSIDGEQIQTSSFSQSVDLPLQKKD